MRSNRSKRPLDFRRKRLIIYDLDGTLIDTRRDIADAANHMRVKMGLYPIVEERIWGYVGKGLVHLVQSCLETEDVKKIRAGAKVYRRYYAQHLLDKSDLYPGGREFLELFRGERQAMITNKPNPYAETMLKALFVYRYFFKVVAGDKEYPYKPDPASTLAVMKAADVQPEETLWVGDSTVDIETARAAGVHVAIVAHGFTDREKLKAAAPDKLYKDFQSLLNDARKALFGGRS